METAADDRTRPPGSQTDEPPAKHRKKKDKVRSAWISFVGRIVAQILGAAATITLGLALADRLRADPNHAGDAAIAGAVEDRGLSVAVLPLELFSSAAGGQHLADGLTEQLISNLMTVPDLRVVSRTSAMQYRQHPRSVPEIAQTLGVSMVIEGCLIRDGDRMRITARVIDALRDMNLGSVARSVPARSLLTGEGELAQSMARELADVMRETYRPR